MRSHCRTSKEGEEFIKPFKPNHKAKILDGLERLRIGGTQEELAAITGLRPDQVWKRMNDLVKDGEVYDTMITRKLRSGVQGIVWQKFGLKTTEVTPNPRTMLELKNVNILKQLNLML